MNGLPELAPTLSGPERPVAVGERAAFRVVLRNRGAAAANGLAVAVTLPPQVRPIEARGGRPETAADGKAIITLDGPLAAGGEATVEIIIEGTAAGTARLQFEVRATHLQRPLVKEASLVVAVP